MATRVFLLSADEKAVHVITQILDEQDIRFEHSSDATFTLKRLAGQHFDVLVVDCDNTDSAMQVFNSARASHLNKGAVAVAIVEGKAGVPNAFRLGASLVLTKPVSLEQARNTLRTAVGMTKKDGPEARSVVIPPAQSPAAASAPAPALAPTPVPAHIPAPIVSPAPAPVPVAVSAPPIPIAAPLPVPVASTVKPTPAALATPVPASPVAAAGTPIQPATPVQPPPPTVTLQASPVPSVPPSQPMVPKPLDLAPVKAALVPFAPETIATKETSPVEKAPTISVAVPPKPALQLSETRVLKAEEEPPVTAKAEKEPLAATEKSPMSLSSAMLESSESEAAIDKLETELSTAKSEFKKSSPIEMFAPVGDDPDEPALDAVSDDMDDSAATLRASAVPAFGGLAQQPFAGLEPSASGSRGLLIGGLVAALAVGGFAGAWFYAPGFQKTVRWEYSRLDAQIHGSQAKPATTADIKPVSVPTPAPAPVPPADQSVTAAANVPSTPGSNPPAAGTTAPAPVVTAPAAPASAPATATTAPLPGPQAPKNPPSNATPATAATSGAGASLLNTSATTPGVAAKPADLFEVPEDYADDQVVHRVHPAYPNAARVRKLQGAVVLQAIINKQGKVDSLQLVSGDPLLAQAAADAVKQWRYKPYSHNGDPVEFQTRVTVDFKLP